MSEGRREVVEKRGWRRCFEGVRDWFNYKDKGEWLNEMKGGISIAASLIATMAFQLATNPPGGVNKKGESVMAELYLDEYKAFLIWNAISFIASISVCLMLVSGIPLNHRFPTWLLSIGMCVAITAFVITYLIATDMVTPDSAWKTFEHLYYIGIGIWLALLGIVVLFLIIRLLVWSSTVSKISTKPIKPVNNPTPSNV